MIYRTKKNKDNPYVITNKVAVEDSRLSAKAKGLMWWFLSKPDNWKVYESVLVKAMADGRDSIRSGLAELERYGYISRLQERDDNGKFSTTEFHVHEQPDNEGTSDATQVQQKQSVDGKSAVGEDLPWPENPSTDNPTLLINNKIQENNNYKNTAREETNDLKDKNEETPCEPSMPPMQLMPEGCSEPAPEYIQMYEAQLKTYLRDEVISSSFTYDLYVGDMRLYAVYNNNRYYWVNEDAFIMSDVTLRYIRQGLSEMYDDDGGVFLINSSGEVKSS